MGLADIRIYIRQLATMNYEHFAYETLRLLLGHFATVFSIRRLRSL